MSQLRPLVATGHVLVASSPYPNPQGGHLVSSHILVATGLTVVADSPWTLPPTHSHVTACRLLVATSHV